MVATTALVEAGARAAERTLALGVVVGVGGHETPPPPGGGGLGGGGAGRDGSLHILWRCADNGKEKSRIRRFIQEGKQGGVDLEVIEKNLKKNRFDPDRSEKKLKLYSIKLKQY